ncbi:hypothetical protein VTP01DRAFT_10329 [Rhizomucor pusillus]|uniref:uncharacterized protein n=1 Tax=Rhizomucor pusillus TaxID=4840 RepID=UPI00374390E2
MTRSPEDLASAGSVFALDDKNQIVSYETGKPVRLSDDSSTYPLILEKIDDGELQYVIRTADRRKNHRYVFSGLERLRIEDEPDSMAMFSVFQQ